MVLDDNFKTLDSLYKGAEPATWKWIAYHERKYHSNDNNEIIDGTMIWKDSEVESGTLFEVPKEHNLSTTNNSL